MSTIYELYRNRELAAVEDGEVKYFQTAQGLQGKVTFTTDADYESYDDYGPITRPMLHVHMDIEDEDGKTYSDFDFVEYMPFHEDHDVYYHRLLNTMEKDIIEKMKK
jgi:hypothetical protein